MRHPSGRRQVPDPSRGPSAAGTGRRVAVLLGSSLAWREQVMRGIAGRVGRSGRWHVYSAPEGAEDSVFFGPRYTWDGLIVRPSDSRFLRRVLSLGVPTVAVGSFRLAVPGGLRSPVPRVRVDDGELVRHALRHLTASGLRRFAYCNSLGPAVREERGPAFAAAVAEAGLPLHRFPGHRAAGWQARQRQLARWLGSLPKPVGVLAWNPDVACQVIEACQRAGLRVPEEVAVVSADDDAIKCELSDPPVTAVPIPAAAIGEEAARLLELMMDGSSNVPSEVLVPPSGIVHVRGSSLPADASDRFLRRAVELLRDRCQDPTLDVGFVADEVGVNRRWLERRFSRSVGTSPRKYLQAQRLDRAKQLLCEPRLTVAAVGQACGLPDPSYFSAWFRRHAGLRPLEFRRRFSAR